MLVPAELDSSIIASGIRGDDDLRAKPLHRGTSIIRNRHPPEDHPRTLGIGLL